MTYEYITSYTSANMWPGRPQGISFITIHWWGDPASRPTFHGVCQWLCREDGSSSAHYVVEAGRVACLVAPGDRAWHGGSANHKGIGIECNPRMSSGDLETVAELIADLRREYGDLPLYPHSDFMQTACPGTYKAKLGWLDARARQIQNGTAPTPTPVASGVIPVDGWWGPATTKALQRINGTPVDGEVSGQYVGNKEFLPGAAGGWEFTDTGEGSQLIAKMQTAFKVTPDGVMGPASVRGMQRYYKVTVDGYMGPDTVRAMQTAINRQLSK